MPIKRLTNEEIKKADELDYLISKKFGSDVKTRDQIDKEELEIIKERINKNKKSTKKTYKEGNIMKGRSDLKKKGDKYTVDTNLNIKKGLDDKVKRALKKSVMTELDKQIRGGTIQLDLSSDDETDGKGLYAGRPRGGQIEPLVKFQQQQQAVDNYLSQPDPILGMIIGEENPNIIDVVNLEGLDQMSDKTIIKKYNAIAHLLDTIGEHDYEFSFDLDYIQPFSNIPSSIKKEYRNIKNYENYAAGKAKELLKEVKDELYGYFNMLEGTGITSKKRRGRPRKNDIKTYGNVLEHLVGHIKDPKEPIDKKDYKQAKEIIGAIEKKKRGRPRKVEGGKVDLGKALGIKPKKGSASYNARQ